MKLITPFPFDSECFFSIFYTRIVQGSPIPWLSSVKYLTIVLSFMFRASPFAIRMTSIIEIGRFLPDVRTELNSPSVVRPMARL